MHGRDIKKKKYIYKEGDWECPNSKCKNKNFAKRVKCNLCATLKPEIIKAREKSRSNSKNRMRSRSRSRNNRRKSESRKRSKPTDKFGGKPGLFKEGDWRCEKCNNVNFSWRVACNVCKESKDLVGEDGFKEKNYQRDRYAEKSRHGQYFDRRKRKYSRSRSRDRRHPLNSRSLSASSLFSSKSDSRDNRRRKSYHNDKDRERTRRRSPSKSRSSPSSSPYTRTIDKNLMNNHGGSLSTNNNFYPANSHNITVNSAIPVNNFSTDINGPQSALHNIFDMSLSMMKNHYKAGDKSDSDSVHKMRFIKKDN
jgi:hypothetical protein